MKEFLIKKLSIKDFKGQTRTFTPNDVRTFVKGANGVGKTTLYKAFCWLLTSYTDSTNVKNHELFDSRLELTHETPEASVCATIVLDGEEYTIKRVAKAKFSRKRGSQEWTKDASDTYRIFIDDIETSASDFNSWVERNIGSVELLPYMLMGERFANLVIDDKKSARKILEQITGEIIIDMMHGDYTMIKKDLQKYPIEQLLERYKAQLKPLNQRNNVIDALIETKESELHSFDDIDFNALEMRIGEKTKEIEKVDECIADASKALEPLICEREKLIKEIHETTVELGDKRIEWESKLSYELSDIKRRIDCIDANNKEITKKNKIAHDEYDLLCATMECKKKQLQTLNAKRDELLKRRDEVKARVFNMEVCAYCGHILSEYDKDKERKLFNERKEADLQVIVNEGKIVKEQIEILNKKISNLAEHINEGFHEIPLENKDELMAEYNFLMEQKTPFEETDVYKTLYLEINYLKSKLLEIKVDKNEFQIEKSRLLSELQELNREYGKKAVKDGFERDIELLKLEKRNLGSEIVRIEGCIATIKEYEEERAKIISDKINEKLDDCRIVMYSRQKDGTLKPDCVVTSNDDVKYATLNNSARIRICLSLQRMFCKHFNINLPVFVDESSVFDSEHLPMFDAQTIYLFASDDKVLIVE